MSISINLDPAVENLALAIGLLSKSGSGRVSLDSDFFRAPWSKLASIFSNEDQRAALVSALEALVPQKDLKLVDAASPVAGMGGDESGALRNAYPIVEASGNGQIYLVVTREGAAPGSPMRLSLIGEAQADNDGPGVVTELVLLTAEGSAIAAVAGTPEYPLSVTATAPVSANGAQLTATAKIVAPPNANLSRFALGLDTGNGDPLVFDLADAGPRVANLTILLLDLALAQIDPLPDGIARLAEALPELTGLTEGMPQFPASDLLSDPSALRNWLAELATSELPDGRSAMAAFVEAIATLTGADFDASVQAIGSVDQPWKIALMQGGASVPGVNLTFALGGDDTDSLLYLFVGLELDYAGSSAVDAALIADASLLSIPLSGSAPVRYLDRFDLRLDATASGNPLVPVSGTGSSTFGVGGLRAGLRCLVTGGQPDIVPVLELNDVTIGIGSSVSEFETIDFTQLGSVTNAAESIVEDAITSGLGASGQQIVDALRALIGLGTNPGVNIGEFASNPPAAVAAYYRALLASPEGWEPIISAVSNLIGNGVVSIKGTGTPADPWRTPIEFLSTPAESPLAVELTLCNQGTSASPELALAIRGSVSEVACEAALDIRIFQITLPPGGSGYARWLASIDLEAIARPTGLQAPIDGLEVQASGVALSAQWVPGAPFDAEVEIRDIVLKADGEEIALGTFAPLDLLNLDTNQPDLGLGLQPNTLWPALRTLLARAAQNWLGDAGSALFAVLGIANSSNFAPEQRLPLLEPQAGEDILALLRDPGGAVRAWLFGLIQQPAQDIAGSSGPAVDALVRFVRALLLADFSNIGGLPILGGGSRQSPWRFPLLAEDAPVALTAWLDEDGPPASLATATLEALADPDINANNLIACADRLIGHAAWLSGALAKRDYDQSAAKLEDLADHLDHSDGILPVAAAMPIRADWLIDEFGSSGHADACADPVMTQRAAARIAEMTDGLAESDWTILYVAPRFAGPNCWQPLLDAQGVTTSENISMRVPGIEPWLADPGIIRPSNHYILDLANDGQRSVADGQATLERVVGALGQTRTASKFILVGHSYLGLAAEAFVAAHHDQSLGLIAIAAPLGHAPSLDLLTDDLADAVHLARELAPSALTSPDNATGRMLHFIGQSLDGYPLGSEAGAIPGFLAAPAWQRGGAAPSLGDVPAIAFITTVAEPLLPALAAALAVDIAPLSPDLPTHLCWGAQLDLGIPEGVNDELQASARLSLQLGDVELATGNLTQSGAGQIGVRVDVWRGAGNWLVNGPAPDGLAIGRARHMAFTAEVTPAGVSAETSLSVMVSGAGLRGDGALTPIDLDDPRVAELLDMLIIELDQPGTLGAPVEALLELIDDFGFMRRRTVNQPAAFLADAFADARSNGNAWFGSRIPALLDRPAGLLGFVREDLTPPDGGPWRLVYDSLPFEVRIDIAPWRVSAGPTSAGVQLAGIADFAGVMTIEAADCQISRDFVCTIAGMELDWTAQDELILAGGWLPQPLTLYPTDPAEMLDILAQSVPLLLGDSMLRALAEQALGGARVNTPIWPVFQDPGGWLSDQFSQSSNLRLEASQIDEAVRLLAGALKLDSSAAHALLFPGILGLSIEDGQTNPVTTTIKLETLSPVILWQDNGQDAAIEIDLSIAIDPDLNGAPGGLISLEVPLPATSDWGALTIELGIGPAGPIFTVSTDNGVEISVLPQFSGFDTLASAGVAALLPLVLDRLESEFPGSSAMADASNVAAALDLHDATKQVGQRFQEKSDRFAILTEELVDGNFQSLAPGFATALKDLLETVTGTALQIDVQGGEITATLPGVVGGSVSMGLDLSLDPPAVSLAASGISLDPITLDLAIGVTGDDLTFVSTILLEVDVIDGVTLAPTLNTQCTIPFASAPPIVAEVIFFPLGVNAFGIEIVPTPRLPTEAELVEVATEYLLPLAGNILLAVADPLLDREMWNGGRTVGDLVEATGFITRSSTSQPYRFVDSLPGPVNVVRGGLDLLTGLAMPLPGDLELTIVSDNQNFGLGLTGHPRFVMGDYALTLHLGLPEAYDMGWDAMGEGTGLFLLDLSDANNPTLTPVLRLGGLGVSFGKENESDPLIQVGGFQLGGAGGYIGLDLALAGSNGIAVQGDVLGAVEIQGLGLSITLPGDGGNAVASSLVKSEGEGDSAPGVPPFDMLIGNSPQGFAVSFSGEPQITIEINRTFGPLHIDSISLLYNPIANRPGELGISLDAGISIAGVSVAAEDLALFVPLDRPDEIDEWRIDLSGLAMSYSASALSVGGGLLKAVLPDGSIEYRGALSVNIADFGLSAIGAYARPTDAEGQYTSLFAFLAVSAPLGGPPYLFVTGIAAGAGYNRRLLTPRDPSSVPAFPLISAMDGASGTDPMDQLERMGTDIPPSRGALWFAAGVKFSTFELLRTTALVTVAIDRGFEITLMGLMRLSLPPVEGAQIVSLELALSAKYSTVDQILSIQAELTDNSWLLSRDCRLTGGFAFVVWMRKPEVILSVGGYSKNFSRPDHYPIVPRVGFDWSVGSGISIKGGSFFAITHSAVMVGGSLEASYKIGPVRAWFIAELDVIVSWDPFSYEAAARVEVGVEVKLQACLFGKCISAPPFRATISATLYLEGPPLSGLVEVNVAVASIRIPFGNKQAQTFLSWTAVRDKYVGLGSVASIAAGGLTADEPADGTEAKPWPVASEFSMRIESKMPATGLTINGASQSASGAPSRIDLVPCGPNHGRISNILNITIARRNNAGNWQDLTASEIARLDQTLTNGSFPAAVWDGAASYVDSRGNQVVDTSHPMLTALSTLIIASAPEIVEATGNLPELPFSSMVDEQATRSMSFGKDSQDADRSTGGDTPFAGISATNGGGTATLTATLPFARMARMNTVAEVAVRSLIQPQMTSSVGSRIAGMSLANDTAMATSSFNKTQIWALSTQGGHTLKPGSSRQRVVALSATGAVLNDIDLENDDAEIADGAQSLVVAAPTDGALLGWELTSQLVKAGPATFIAPGAVITTDRPWQPRKMARFGGQPRQSFPATKLVRANGNLTTRISWSEANRPESLLVRLDRLADDAELGAVTVTVSGADVGPIETIIKGDRVELLYPLTMQGEEGAISVSIESSEDWMIAGVIAIDEDAASVSSLVTTNEFVRIIPRTATLNRAISLELEVLNLEITP